jgi:hypothetical protein
MRRGSIVVALAAVLMLSNIGTAWSVVPKNGVYQGIVNGSANSGGHNEGEGYFRAKGTSATKQIVPPGTFTCGGSGCYVATILAPSDFACNAYNANLETTTIPVSAGAFDYKGKANIGPMGARMNIRFKGAWATTAQVKGFTRIWDTSCDRGRLPWTMNTPPPA